MWLKLQIQHFHIPFMEQACKSRHFYCLQFFMYEKIRFFWIYFKHPVTSKMFQEFPSFFSGNIFENKGMFLTQLLINTKFLHWDLNPWNISRNTLLFWALTCYLCTELQILILWGNTLKKYDGLTYGNVWIPLAVYTTSKTEKSHHQHIA